MKACLLNAAGAIALTFGLAACIPSADRPESAPAPAAPSATPSDTVASPAPPVDPAPPTAPPTDVPPALQQPEYDNYLDAPQTPGTWTYVAEPGETLALFGASVEEPRLILRCERGAGSGGMVGIARVLDSAAGSQQVRAMQVVTETATRLLEAEPVASRQPLLVAQLPAGDPLLDAMAITRGRIALEVEGAATLYVPAWAEITRVIEDCR